MVNSGDLQVLKQEKVKAQIGRFYLEIWMYDEMYTVEGLKALINPKYTTHRVMLMQKDGIVAKMKFESDRHVLKMTSTGSIKIAMEITEKVGLIQPKLAQKYDVGSSMVNYILQESQIKYSKRKAIPKYYQEQHETAQKANGKFKKDFFSFSGSASEVKDYESYVYMNILTESGYFKDVGSSGDDAPLNKDSSTCQYTPRIC